MASRTTAPSRRTSRTGRAAPAVARGARGSAGTARAPRRAGSPVELRPLRLAALVLLLVAAALYVSPLRAFFAQQDNYARQAASLKQAQLKNSALRAQIATMRTRDYVTRQAREQYQLVPSGLQAFVVKGLPASGPADAQDATSDAAGWAGAKTQAPSLLARLADLWHTIRQ
jgi:cell division protein FtsB